MVSGLSKNDLSEVIEQGRVGTSMHQPTLQDLQIRLPQ